MWNFLYVVLLSMASVAQNLTISDINRNLMKLADEVATNYYVGKYDGRVALMTENDLFEDVRLSTLSVFRISSDNFCDDPAAFDIMIKVFEEMCSHFIVHIAEPRCFFKIWLDVQWNTTQRPHAKILFLPVVNATNFKIADQVFSLKESDYSSSILAVDVDAHDPDWPFSIYAGNFYERVEKPGRNPKILLDKWNINGTFMYNVNLMPNFVENLRNKTLKIMTFNYLPYTHVDPLDGTEIKLIQEFCRKHNCSLEAVDDGHYWGDIFENGTSDGLGGMVYDGRADFGAAAVYLWLQYFRFIDYSTSYLYSASTLLVPKPHLVSGWKTPFMPFDIPTWIGYGLSVVMAAVFMYIITFLTIKCTRFSEAVKKRQMFLDQLDCVFRALGLAVLQQPSSPLVPHTPIRHLFTAFEFLFLFTSLIYSAELASYLTVPQYTKPIDTLVELANSGMLWIGEHESWTYSLKDVTDPEIVTIVKNYRVMSEKQLNELAPTGKYGLIVERLRGGHYTEPEHVSDQVIAQSHMMAENIIGSPPVIVLRRGSPYKKYFDKVISEVLRGGLYTCWEGQMASKYLTTRKQLALKDADHPHYKDVPQRLAVSHIQGPLFILLIGIAISSFVFTVELLVYRMNTPKIVLVLKLK